MSVTHEPGRGARPRIRTAIGALVAAGLMALGLVLVSPPTAASADSPCQLTEYVQDLTVTPWDGGNVDIHITPGPALRNITNSFDRDVTVSMWHTIQSCVPNLYGGVADSIWQQLQCHQWFATVPGWSQPYATGPTFDLETWHPAFEWTPTVEDYVDSHCLNERGTQPAGPTGDTYTPGAGYLDQNYSDVG